jgi:putative restriction endonuclease
MPVSFDKLPVGSSWTRQQLADAWGYRGYQAFARGVFTPRGGREIILFVSEEKPGDFTQYQDGLSGDLLRWEGEQGHQNDQRIVAAKVNGEKIHVFFRREHRSPFTYLGQAEVQQHELLADSPSRFLLKLADTP